MTGCVTSGCERCRCAACKAYAGSVTARRGPAAVQSSGGAEIDVNCFLEIVDNRRPASASTAADARAVAAAARAAPDASRCCSRARCPSVVQGELERMILVGRAARRATSSTRWRSPPASASRAARCARPSACSRSRAWCAPRRTAACSCADLPVEEATRSSTCARRWTSSSAAACAETIAPAALKELRALVERMEQARQGQGRARLPPAQPRFHDRARRARRQRQADRDLPQADQGAEPVPPRSTWPRLAAAGLGRRAPRRSSRRSPRATPTPPAARCSTTSWRARSARIKNHRRRRAAPRAPAERQHEKAAR